MMKKLLQTFSLAMCALLLTVSLTSCSSAPSPDNIYEVLDRADSAKVVITMEVGDTTLTKITTRFQGDAAKMTMVVETMGQRIETITYLETDGDTEYLYAKGADGKWAKTEAPADSDNADMESFQELYNSKNYQKFDRKASRYYMKEDFKIEIEGTTYSDGYLEIGKDEEERPYYELYVKTITQSDGLTTEGAMTIVIGEIGDVEVRLPKVGESD